MPNRLGAERSPYLLQHANNPVEWYPWGQDAFEKARREDKPIFLSVGYSTCHWCHVMEHESFESLEIAEILNRDFVPIKVDREERPDVDRIYMTFVQATTGAGGWPMSVWLTPDLKPFYGGTYYPPSSRWGRPGFVEVLAEIARVWQAERPRVDQTATVLVERLAAAVANAPARRGDARPVPIAEPDELERGVEQFQESFDAQRGGFGAAPKFPRPSELLFLLAEHARTGHLAALEMVEQTLDAMALGGMRDHVGGGFHRYAVDAEWRVPHFEKMLYDQAQLVLAYLEAAQASRRDGRGHAAVAEDTLEYVRRDMTDALGGFYSAEDADSVPPEQADLLGARKTEGGFYVWTDEELVSVLGPDADVVRLRFGIRPEGNAPVDPQGEFGRKNLLYTAMTIEGIASRMGRSADEIVAVLARARQTLLEVRAGRPRPHLDDKILTGWNGLMVAAFARAARVLSSPGAAGYLASARQAAAFLRASMWDAVDGRLLRRYRTGEAAIDAYCEDYALLVWGLLELFQVDGDPAWLAWALQLQARQDELFWDAHDGGWFSTTGQDPSLLLRMKDDYDGAEPSASSVSALNHMTVGHLTGGEDAARRVGRTLRRYGPHMGQLARVAPLMLRALSTYHAGTTQVVIAGEPDEEDTRRLRAVVAELYLPFAVVVPVRPGDVRAQLTGLLPWIEPMRLRDGRATAYVCRDFACQEPTGDPETLRRQLTP